MAATETAARPRMHTGSSEASRTQDETKHALKTTEFFAMVGVIGEESHFERAGPFSAPHAFNQRSFMSTMTAERDGTEQGSSSERRQEIEDLKKAQAVQTATDAGAHATQAAVQAGGMATQTAAQAGLAVTVMTGAASLIVGMVLGALFTNVGRAKR
jgi:hypothetical protein